MQKPETSQITKLPKWAQEYIANLERREVDLLRDIEQMKLTEPTRIYWDVGVTDAGNYLPEHSSVAFAVRGRRVIRASLRGDRVYINADNAIEIALTGGANACEIKLKERSEVKQCPQQAIADSETCLLSCAT